MRPSGGNAAGAQIASGLYLGAYLAGGLAGSAALGALFDMWGWAVCVAGVVAALILAATLATRFVIRG